MYNDTADYPEWAVLFLVIMLSSDGLSSMLNAHFLTIKVKNNSLLQI